MVLSSRWQGVDFSNVEREFLFNKKNSGYVQYLSPDGRLFLLQPSPSFKNENGEYFFAESCNPPPQNSFIETDVESESFSVPKLTTNGWERTVLKKISGWKLIDIDRIARRKKLVESYQIIDYFSLPFKAKQDVVEPIAMCSALFAFSSPPSFGNIGGINAAILSGKNQYEAIKLPLSIIPREFFRQTSRYFYVIAEKAKVVIPDENDEVSLAYRRPEKIPMDIPIVIEDIATTSYSFKKSYNDVDRNLITAYLLDSLLLKPDPLETIEKLVTEAVYIVRDEYQKAGISVYKQNVGNSINRLTAAIARLQLEPKAKSEHIKKALDLWSEMQRKTKYLFSMPLPISKIYEISPNTRKLYTELHDVYGTDYWIPTQEVKTITSLKHDQDFSFALNELVERGYAIKNKKGIKLLNL